MRDVDANVRAVDPGVRVSADVIETGREVGVDGITADRWDFQ